MKLKDAMLVYAPMLEEQYKAYVIHTFDDMVKDLGYELKGVYNNWKWARIYHTINANLTRRPDPETPGFNRGYMISPVRLNKNAKEYGERISLEWFAKLQKKIGDVQDSDVSELDTNGFLTVIAIKSGHRISVLQQPILNVSSRGLIFHQFPARIYVDGKSVSEAQFKKQFHLT